MKITIQTQDNDTHTGPTGGFIGATHYYLQDDSPGEAIGTGRMFEVSELRSITIDYGVDA